MRLILVLLFGVACIAHGAEADLLEPDKAFRFSARLKDARSIEVTYDIAPGYYLYRQQFKFSAAPAEAKLGPPQLPPGKMKKDEFFGEVETYRGNLTILVPLEVAEPKPSVVTLAAVSQGCADAGVCYVPHEQKARLQLAAAGGTATGAPPEPFPAPERARAGADDARFASVFAEGFWVTIAKFFGAGLILAFTPCVLPMVPILSGVIVGGGGHVTKMRGFLLAALYVLGMALTYAVAGVAAGLSGAMLAAALQNPWVLGAFAAVFVALALAMFGLYELQLPVALQSSLANASNRMRGGQAAGVFAMGVLSALIVGPCVAAPLAGALLYISLSRDVVLGGSALFAMALGMGVPLLAVGASAGALVPRAGPWMETVKRFFGVLLLGLAIYIVSPLVPTAVHMGAWAVLLIVTAVFMRAIDPLPPNTHAFDRFSKGIGVIALVVGIAFAIGALSGGRDFLQPLAGLRAGAGFPQAGETPFQRVGSIAELEGRIATAGKPVMLDFYADWCVSCKEMERFTFTDERVRQRLGALVLLQADVTANSPEHIALLKRFRLFGPPGIVFFDAAGREIEGLRVIGFQPAHKFAAVLDEVLRFQRTASQ
ncbi:MAG TPA: protein-disulfide reductase DsbD [Burkholderiales bacterium]|jgi:thiol:disulfide interchange protein DsbD|nr:protein-disulfide reductase DsbD [Burkholderiales bacterium]